MIPLTIWHIGGDGPIGPAQAIVKRHPQTKLVTFDARAEHGSPICFDEKEGEADFYITADGMASSLLRAAPAMADEQVLWNFIDGSRIDRWGTSTEVKKVERVRTTTVDAHAAIHGAPDVLSLDVQGAEMRVLRGAVETMKNLVCLVTEVEFWEIYEGQGLLQDQLAFMREHGFRFVEVLNLQPWHQGAPMGDGFYTVGEALWFRFDGLDGLSADSLLKLTLIAGIFNRVSFARKVMKMAAEKMPQ